MVCALETGNRSMVGAQRKREIGHWWVHWKLEIGQWCAHCKLEIGQWCAHQKLKWVNGVHIGSWKQVKYAHQKLDISQWCAHLLSWSMVLYIITYIFYVVFIAMCIYYIQKQKNSSYSALQAQSRKALECTRVHLSEDLFRLLLLVLPLLFIPLFIVIIIYKLFIYAFIYL